jgi:hypothetical protein
MQFVQGTLALTDSLTANGEENREGTKRIYIVDPETMEEVVV